MCQICAPLKAQKASLNVLKCCSEGTSEKSIEELPKSETILTRRGIYPLESTEKPKWGGFGGNSKKVSLGRRNGSDFLCLFLFCTKGKKSISFEVLDAFKKIKNAQEVDFESLK